MPVTVGSFGIIGADLNIGDGDDVALGDTSGGDALLRWSAADADNEALVLAVGDTSQALHITDKGAVATDWNIALTTDPNVYVHSNTTPATDYLRLGGHTGTAADIDVVGGATLNLQIAGTSEVTMTATQLNVLDGNSLMVGGTSPVTISDGDGSTNLTPTAQIVGTSKTDGSLLLMVNSATATSAAAPSVNLVKSAHATLGSNTVVVSGEVLGEVNFFGADGTDFESCAVSIRGLCDGTPGTGDMPGRLSIFTSTDNAETPTERARITGTATVSTLAMGIAGATTGKVTFAGATSGVLTLTPAAAAGTWTMTLPAAVGSAGQQLTDAAGDGVCTWAAASLGEWKNDLGILDPHEALAAVVKAPTHRFTYNANVMPPGQWAPKDMMTGIFAEEAPWAMHGQRDGLKSGIAFSPVNAFGYARAAIEALHKDNAALAERLNRLETKVKH